MCWAVIYFCQTIQIQFKIDPINNIIGSLSIRNYWQGRPLSITSSYFLGGKLDILGGLKHFSRLTKSWSDYKLLAKVFCLQWPYLILLQGSDSLSSTHLFSHSVSFFLQNFNLFTISATSTSYTNNTHKTTCTKTNNTNTKKTNTINNNNINTRNNNTSNNANTSNNTNYNTSISPPITTLIPLTTKCLNYSNQLQKYAVQQCETVSSYNSIQFQHFAVATARSPPLLGKRCLQWSLETYLWWKLGPILILSSLLLW